jgi:chemotaxis protein methyltransferase CheR
LKPLVRKPVTFELDDIRRTLPAGPFALILCRNLAFSYFDEQEQRRVLRGLIDRLAPDGYLVLGEGEHLPNAQPGPQPIDGSGCIYPRAELERCTTG